MTVALDTILVIDVGNSGAKVGAVRGEDVAGPVRLPRVDGRAVREFAGPLLKGKEAVIAIAGSDSGRIENLAWEVRKLNLGSVVEVGPDHKGLAPAHVQHPEKAGVDRRVQVMGAVQHAGSAAAVVAAGTALTVDLGDEQGGLLGGAILPGLGLGAQALASGTAKLPLVELKGEAAMPGLDTEVAMRAGLLVGAAGAVERLLEEAGVDEETPVYLTGQDAPFLEPHLRRPVRSHAGLGVFGVALAVRAHPPRK